MCLLIRWALLAGAIYLASLLIPGIQVSGALAGIVAAAVLALLNALVRPILFLLKTATFPLSLVSLGLWGLLLHFLMNVVLFYLAGVLVPGFQVKGLGAAVLGSALVSVLGAFFTALVGRRGG